MHVAPEINPDSIWLVGWEVRGTPPGRSKLERVGMFNLPDSAEHCAALARKGGYTGVTVKQIVKGRK